MFFSGEGVFVCTKMYGFAQLCTGVFPMFQVDFTVDEVDQGIVGVLGNIGCFV